MISSLGTVLPLALAITISPFPIVAIILMLLSPSAKRSGVTFCLGWLVGLAVPLAIVIALGDAFVLGGTESEPGKAIGTIRIVLGLALIALAYRQWRQRPRPGEDPEMPRWLSGIDAITPVRALGLGLALSAINPKELFITIAAGIALAKTSLSGIEVFVPATVFVLVASLSVIGPLAAYLVMPERIAQPLATMKKWLITNDAVIMTVVLLLIGAVVFSKGLQSF